MSRFLKPVVALAVIAGAALMVAEASSAAYPPPVLSKAKLKILIAKLDPEIKAAQVALATAKAKISKALTDEVLSEAGAVELKSVVELKLALSAVNNAIKHTNLAQKWDKGGD